MTTIQRLCQKVILLDHGSITAEGLPDNVIQEYLGSNKFQKAERIWQSKVVAPGNSIIRLKSIRILDKLNKPISQIDIIQPIKIEIEYWNLKDGSIPSAGIYLKTPDGISVLTSFDFYDRRWGNKPRPVGIYKSSCMIPGNFLAEGSYSIGFAVNSFTDVILCNADCEDLTIDIIDFGKKGGTRGDYKGIWPGVIRPKLKWEIIKDD